MSRKWSEGGRKGSRAAEPAVKAPLGRKPTVRPATVRRKNLLLDQKKLDLLRRSLGASSDQEAVERVIDEAVADRELIEATLALGGALPDIADVGGRS